MYNKTKNKQVKQNCGSENQLHIRVRGFYFNWFWVQAEYFLRGISVDSKVQSELRIIWNTLIVKDKGGGSKWNNHSPVQGMEMFREL